MATDSRVTICHDRRVRRVLQAVARDLTKRIPLAGAASIAGLEPAYFSRCFRKTMGVCFIEWSTFTRIEEAKKLLVIADLSIIGVAASVG